MIEIIVWWELMMCKRVQQRGDPDDNKHIESWQLSYVNSYVSSSSYS